MAKLTAVEWIGVEMYKLFTEIPTDTWEEISELFKQAKEMEKEQIIQSSRISYLAGQEYYKLNGLSKQFAEQHYKETYNK
jgi:hypothetical protein